MSLLKPKEDCARRLKELKWARSREEEREYQKKLKEQQVKITEEEHKRRLEALKSFGIELNCKEVIKNGNETR